MAPFRSKTKDHVMVNSITVNSTLGTVNLTVLNTGGYIMNTLYNNRIKKHKSLQMTLHLNTFLLLQIYQRLKWCWIYFRHDIYTNYGSLLYFYICIHLKRAYSGRVLLLPVFNSTTALSMVAIPKTVFLTEVIPWRAIWLQWFSQLKSALHRQHTCSW